MKNEDLKRFPIYPAGHVFNPFHYSVKPAVLKFREVEVYWPCRLDAMAINPAAVAYNDDMLFNPGEVVISIDNFIKTRIRLIDTDKGKLVISEKTRRKVLVKHAYHIITKVLKVTPSLEIDVDDSGIIKHCGFGSSSSTISSVVAAINEMYGKPIKNIDLIKYVSSNHGEEVEDNNCNDLKAVQSIGGGATSGFLPYGITIIAGRAVPIAHMNLKSSVLIGVPADFKPQSAKVLMQKEEDNLWRFERTGKKYKDIIAYSLLHKALPAMAENNISDLAKVVFDYRFDMGSIDNCSFVYPKMIKLAKLMRNLYEDHHCDMLSLSSVGPAFFAVTRNEKDMIYCKTQMQNLGMNVSKYNIFNKSYKVKRVSL